jgi:hypothetical protein
MEIYAIYNWNISPFNKDLKAKTGEKGDYALLVVPKDPSKPLNTKTGTNDYIICSFPLKAIQTVIPERKITVNAGPEKAGDPDKIFDMILNKIVLDDKIDGYVVVTQYQPPAIPIFGTEHRIRPNELSKAGIESWLTTNNVSLAKVNVTVSRDPRSC